jgi:hypothetical protein
LQNLSNSFSAALPSAIESLSALTRAANGWHEKMHATYSTFIKNNLYRRLPYLRGDDLNNSTGNPPCTKQEETTHAKLQEGEEKQLKANKIL